MTKVLVVDDHPLYREGLAAALSGRPLYATVVGACTTEDALSLLNDDPTFELVIVDLLLGQADGLHALREIGRSHATIPRMAVTGQQAALASGPVAAAGAQGLLLKSQSIAETIAGVQQVLDGGTFWPRPAQPAAVPDERAAAAGAQAGPTLTPRQREALLLLCQGRSNADIARALAISERTVKAHLQVVFTTLAVDSRTQAVVRAHELGLHPPS